MRTPVASVALNALFLDPGVTGGPETYLRQLVPALVAEYPRTRFSVVTTRSGAAALRDEGWEDLVSLRVLSKSGGQRVRRTIAEQVRLPALERRERWDVLHSLAAHAPIVGPTASVMTVMDVIFFKHRTLARVSTFGMRQMTTRAVRRADMLIAPSEASRKEICEVLSLDSSTIAVVPLGIGRAPAVEPTSGSEIRERLGLEGARVVLGVAAKRPHKNQELLVRALVHLPRDVTLVLAGHAEPYESFLRALARELRVEERVRFLGYVPDPELEALWRLADCAAFPTLAEGFGLPVLEAMVRGVPVACSDIPVLHEVAGSAARFFDPHDPAEAAAVIQRTMGDVELAQSGSERASSYSWTATARGTFSAYERAVRRARDRSSRGSRAPSPAR